MATTENLASTVEMNEETREAEISSQELEDAVGGKMPSLSITLEPGNIVFKKLRDYKTAVPALRLRGRRR